MLQVEYNQVFKSTYFVKLTFVVMCSGSASFFSMNVNYIASWRARDDEVEFILVANSSRQWLSIGFTDKQRMVGIAVQCYVYVINVFIRDLILLLGPLITMELIL